MRVILVGCAGHAVNHLQAWLKTPGLGSLVVVARNRERLAQVAAQYEVETSVDLASVVQGADRLDICTPTDTHAELATHGLAAGVPTLVEKPAARTVAQARALQAAAGDTPLACMLNYRYAPLWQRARELVAMRLIGEPLLSFWPVLADNRRLLAGDDFRADGGRAGGALLDGGIHLVDLIPWILNRPLRATTAWLGSLASAPLASHDTALVVFEHEGGVAQLTYSWATPNPTRMPAATIIGTDGTLLVPRSAKLPFEFVRQRDTEEVGMGLLATMPRNDLANALRHFAVDPAGMAAATWEHALAAQEVVERCERSARDGQRILL